MAWTVSSLKNAGIQLLALGFLGAALLGWPQAAQGKDVFEADRYYYFLVSTYAELNRDDAEALKNMVKAADLGAGSYQLKLEAARLFSRTGDNQSALKYAREAITLNPEDPLAHFLTAWLSGAEDDRETAEKEYLKVLELDPGNTETLYWLGALYFDSRRHREAEKFFKRLTVADPSPVSFYHLGNFYLRLDRKEEAITALSTAIKKDPDFADALDDLAGLYEAAGRPKLAERTYRRLLEFRPQTARNGLARLLLKGGRRAEAEKIVAEMLREERRFRLESDLEMREADGLAEDEGLDLRLRLGLYYLEIKHYRTAISEFEAVLNTWPGHDRAAFLLASTLLERQETGGPSGAARATELLKAIKPESPLFVDARLLMTSPVQGRDDRQALAMMEEASQLKPDSPRLKLAEAHFLERLGELEKARTILAWTAENFGPEAKRRQHAPAAPDGKIIRPLSGNPDERRVFLSEAEILFRLAALENQLGHQDASIKIIRQAINLNPSHADALNFLAYSWAEKKENLTEALVLALRADALKPDQGYILDTIAWIHFQMGEPQKALPLLKRAVDLSRRDPVVLDHLGDVLAALNQRQEALKAYRQALEGGFANQEELNEKIKKMAR